MPNLLSSMQPFPRRVTDTSGFCFVHKHHIIVLNASVPSCIEADGYFCGISEHCTLQIDKSSIVVR